MPRGWTWIDDSSVSEEQADQNRPLLDKLAAQWSSLHDMREQRSFLRRALMDEGCDMEDDYEFEDEAEMKSYKAHQKLLDEQEVHEMDFIEHQMAKLGGRMMRPYEHWNEDERYMEYMERDRE